MDLSRSVARVLHLLLLAALVPILAPGPALAGGSCDSPGDGLPAPECSCQLRGGETTAAVPSDFYAIELAAGRSYTFTFCGGPDCPGSGAGYDTRLRLYQPADCSIPVAENDDACGLQSRISYTATSTGTHVLEVTGFTTAQFGPYTLGWLEVSASTSCAAPDARLEVPTTACKHRADSLRCDGVERFYSVVLTQGQTYTFTLCDATCAGAGADFDSQVDLFDPTGVPVGSSSSACGDDGEVVYATDAMNGGGTYCLRVAREVGPGDGFDLGYRVACQPPSNVDLTPVSGGTSAESCSIAQTFRASTAGTGSFTYEWTIVPGAGNTASPSSFRDTRDGSSSAFTSTLTGAGAYQVSVVVSNDCGSARADVDFLLEDRRGPDIVCSAVPCAAPSRALRPPPIEPDRPREALGCASPCTGSNALEADNPFYEIFLDCDNGSYAARTGVAHPVTVASGAKQNVMFGGQSGMPGTSDLSFYVHDTAHHYLDPTGGEACAFDPPDTAGEPQSIGLEAEWSRSPAPDIDLLLREEVVAFGDVEENSGIRLTLAVTNLPSSARPVTMGVRWQIDYQNADDDGPHHAPVTCDPFAVGESRSTEHEFLPAEVEDFFRIRNNTGSPIFGNFTSTTAIVGFPGTGTPDRLVYGYWPAMVSSPWDYSTSEGSPSPDFDSAVLYFVGYQPAAGIVIAPGESFSRSVVIFTAGEGRDCGAFIPGTSVDGEVTVCPDECAEVGATASDGCALASITLVDRSPGAPDCTGNPCTVQTASEGSYVYTWEATDEAGNSSTCTSTVTVEDGPGCNRPPTCDAGGPYIDDCREAAVDVATAEDPDGDELSYSWSSSRPDVTVAPGSGTIPGGPGLRPVPAAVASLDPALPACGERATLTLSVDDGQGGSASCRTEVVFDDQVPPQILGVPPDQTVECDAVPEPAAATAFDNCDELPTLVFEQERRAGRCPDAYTLIRTWTASDVCGNRTVATQVVSVDDTTPPDPLALLEPLPPVPPSSALSPASPASPASARSVCSAPASAGFIVRCGASDNCDPEPDLAPVLVATWHDVEPDGSCVERSEEVPVECDQVVEIRLVAPPCPARPPRSARSAVEVNSAGIVVVSGESVVLEVRATDRCGNSAVAVADPTEPPPPPCQDPLADGSCCPPIAKPQPERCDLPRCGASRSPPPRPAAQSGEAGGDSGSPGSGESAARSTVR